MNPYRNSYPAVVLLSMLCPVCQAWQSLDREAAFEVERTWNKEYSYDSDSLPGKKVVVDVTAGSFAVSGHDSGDIRARVAVRWQGRQESDLAQAEKELRLIVEKTSYGLLIFLETPFRDTNYRYFQRSRNYRFRYDVSLEVPRNMALDLYHVSRGDVRLDGIGGTVRIEALQGDVLLNNVIAAGSVKTVSGDIVMDYSRTPDLDLELHSRFGDIYSGFSYRVMPGPPAPAISRDGALTRYSKDYYSRIRLARGGSLMRLDSIGGDILVRDMR